MNRSISFVIPGIPAPQGSKRHVGNGILVESSQRLRPWRAIAIATIQQKADELKCNQITTAVKVYATFKFPYLKSHYNSKGILRDRSVLAPKTSAPDLDKLLRALFDALTESGIIRDDALIVEVACWKCYNHVPETYVKMQPVR